MSNPLDEALMSKEALGFMNTTRGLYSAAKRGLRDPKTMKGLGKNMAEGAMLTAGGLGLEAAVTGAQKMLGAARKKKDFRDMVDVNPDLADAHQGNPKFFNSAYTSLRTMNPTFGQDPVVAGSMMRRMMDSPESAGGILAASVKTPDSPGPRMNVGGQYGALNFRRGF